jgi:hypothetical protein
MKYFTREASQQLSNWKGSSHWKTLWARYGQELARTRHQLTGGWCDLANADFNEAEFHDTRIFKIERPNSAELILSVDMSPRHEKPQPEFADFNF